MKKPKNWPRSHPWTCKDSPLNRRTAWGLPSEVMSTVPAPLTLHTAPHQCWRNNKLLRLFHKFGKIKNPPRFVLSAAPPEVQPFERKAHVSLRCRSRESPCAKLSAYHVARHALSCAVRIASYADDGITQGCTSRPYNSKRVLHCLVRNRRFTCF